MSDVKGNLSRFKEYKISYANRLLSSLESVDDESICSFITELERAQHTGAQVFFVGNGGSAATANHFANDLSLGIKGGRPVRAISLSSNQAVITALANDEGYDKVFIKQLQVAANPGDILVGISASGNSPNILTAVDWCRKNEVVTIGVTGFEGGRLAQICDISLCFTTELGDYGVSEDCHMILDHLITNYLISKSS